MNLIHHTISRHVRVISPTVKAILLIALRILVCFCLCIALKESVKHVGFELQPTKPLINEVDQINSYHLGNYKTFNEVKSDLSIT